MKHLGLEKSLSLGCEKTCLHCHCDRQTYRPTDDQKHFTRDST